MYTKSKYNKLLTPLHFCAYPKTGPGFPTTYVTVFY